ncbi:MAG TPA: PLP-dependent aminotransferase family protein [Amycolatopsis sp.]|nr:PLP-dependent aminotransferase family protein [Amycolatopsis sp.]
MSSPRTTDSTSCARPLARRMSAITSSAVRDLLALTARPGVISFAGGMPAPELFDAAGLRAAFDRALSGSAARHSLQYSPTEGDPALRALIADRLTARGLRTTASDLLITTGSQQALNLISTALLDPGSVVLVEEPGYLSALQCFHLAGARIVPVPGDAEGMLPDRLAEIAAREDAAVLYLVPTFANPTGRTLGARRRRRVAEIAADHDFRIIEDDPYHELRYRGEPMAPISALPTAAGRSVYLGSFSKVAAPGMRLGWLRAPRPLLDRIAILKQANDLHTSTVDQAAAAHYLENVDLDARVRTLRAAYRLRRDAMLAELPGATPPGTVWTEPDGGMFLWLRLPGSVDTAELLPEALRHDVAFVPGAAFHVNEPDRATMRLSFAAHTPEVIAQGMRRLAMVLRG